jgi:hypothetical protein
VPTTTGWSDELPYRIRASYKWSAADRRTTTEDKDDSSLAQVRPGDLVDSEEWEADYHDPKSQLNKQSVRVRHVWGKKLYADEGPDADKKRQNGTSRLPPAQQTQNELKRSKVVHDDEWEADYYDRGDFHPCCRRLCDTENQIDNEKSN